MVNHRHLLFIVEHLQDSLDCSFEEKSIVATKEEDTSSFFFFFSCLPLIQRLPH